MTRSNVALCAVLVVSLAFAGSASAVPTIIDDFDAPNMDFMDRFHLANPKLLQTVDASILGGERDLMAMVAGSPRASSFVGEISQSEFVFASSSPSTTATLTYDGTAASPGLGGIDLLALGDTMQFDFESVDVGSRAAGLEVEISVIGTNPADIAFFYGEIPSDFSPSSYDALFSGFNDPNGALADANKIIIDFNPYVAEDVDFTLDTISVVPEPSTIVGLLTVALFGFVGWMKRRRVA